MLWLALAIVVGVVGWRVAAGRLPGWYRCGVPGCGRWLRIGLLADIRGRYCRRHGHFEDEDEGRPEAGDRGMGPFGVYVLELDGKEGRFHVGRTRNLERRLREHAAGLHRTTAGRSFRLVYSERVGARRAAARRWRRLRLMSLVRPRRLRRLAAVQAAARREIEG